MKTRFNLKEVAQELRRIEPHFVNRTSSVIENFFLENAVTESYTWQKSNLQKASKICSVFVHQKLISMPY
jgi:hypothetical protein